MRAADLRIGNRVELYGRTATIQRDDFATNEYGIVVDKCKPIKLTEQWLIDFGFEDNVLDLGGYTNAIFKFIPQIELLQLFAGDGKILTNGIKYVNQLQNLYHSLTGEELTLKQ